MGNIVWSKLLRNPFKYYIVYKRKNNFLRISILKGVKSLWSTMEMVTIPLMKMSDMNIEPTINEFKYTVHAR